jgi:uncharacterized circularly permuted ATP-grasp superfamily protein
VAGNSPAAVTQRARLLNAVLKDLYGPQDPAQGRQPAAGAGLWSQQLPLALPGDPAAGDTYLHLYAADLARSPDGRWWVIADRTQAPSGAGYALENRTIVGRVFSRAVPRPARPASRLVLPRTAGQPGALGGTGEAPLIVLLTPGPYNETYFEHAYLARYLGFPLVEGRI